MVLPLSHVIHKAQQSSRVMRKAQIDLASWLTGKLWVSSDKLCLRKPVQIPITCSKRHPPCNFPMHITNPWVRQTKNAGYPAAPPRFTQRSRISCEVPPEDRCRSWGRPTRVWHSLGRFWTHPDRTGRPGQAAAVPAESNFMRGPSSLYCH